MDTADKVAVYGIIGGMVAGALQTKFFTGSVPTVNKGFWLKYFALFGSMGCISAAILHVALPNVNEVPIGLLGGAAGSYVLLGIGNYM